MSDEHLRELERRWKETGSVEDEDVLINALLRTGRAEDVAAHFEAIVARMRTRGLVRFVLGLRENRSSVASVAELGRVLGAQPLALGTEYPRERAIDALRGFVGRTVSYDDEVMPKSDAASIAYRFLALVGSDATYYSHRFPAWERLPDSYPRLRRDGVLLGQVFEGGVMAIGRDVVGLVWIADGDAECRAEGRVCRLDQLGIREFNFGQHWRTPGIEDVEYETAIPTRLASQFLSFELTEYVREAQAHPSDLELESALRDAGWPSAESIMERPDLSRLALGAFGFDLLLGWLGWSPREHHAYVANTIDIVEVQPGRLVLKGRARRASRPGSGVALAYQDF